MKKTTRKTVVLILILVIVLSTCALARGTGRIWEVTGDGVHLRSGPGTDYPSYGLLWKGERFVEDSCFNTGHVSTANWIHDVWSDTHRTCGFVSASYAKFITSIP